MGACHEQGIAAGVSDRGERSSSSACRPRHAAFSGVGVAVGRGYGRSVVAAGVGAPARAAQAAAVVALQTAGSTTWR